MRKWSLMFVAWLGISAQAGTFIGNGGSEGDVELAVSLQQIEETLTVVQGLSDQYNNFCTCNRTYERSPLCQPLKTLSTEQTNYCKATLLKQAPQLLALVRRRDNLRVRWTHSPIEVREGGRLRAADAVADAGKDEITINLPAFRKMRAAERVFLLTHELFHLTKLNGKSMDDSGAVGPFAGAEGGRNLINSMAAATSVLQGEYPRQIKSYKAKRHRSQAWKPIWIDFNIGASRYLPKHESVYGFEDYDRGQLRVRYQFTHWGAYLAYHTLSQDKKVESTIQLDEKVKVYGAGVSYRIFFSDDPLTFWGQNNLVVQAGLEYVTAEYKGREFVPGRNVTIGEEEDEEIQTLGASVGAVYYIPLFWGFWGTLA